MRSLSGPIGLSRAPLLTGTATAMLLRMLDPVRSEGEREDESQRKSGSESKGKGGWV